MPARWHGLEKGCIGDATSRFSGTGAFRYFWTLWQREPPGTTAGERECGSGLAGLIENRSGALEQGLREARGGLSEALGGLREAREGLREARGGQREAHGDLREAHGDLREARGGLREACGGLRDSREASKALTPKAMGRELG